MHHLLTMSSDHRFIKNSFFQYIHNQFSHIEHIFLCLWEIKFSWNDPIYFVKNSTLISLKCIIRTRSLWILSSSNKCALDTPLLLLLRNSVLQNESLDIRQLDLLFRNSLCQHTLNENISGIVQRYMESIALVLLNSKVRIDFVC